MDRPAVSGGGRRRCWEHPQPPPPTSFHPPGQRPTERGLETPSLESRVEREKKPPSFKRLEKWKRVPDEADVLVGRTRVFPHVLSGFLKDAKSVYLKQRLLACEKITAVHTATFYFYSEVCLFPFFRVFLLFLLHTNYEQVLILFVSEIIIYLDLDVLCKGSFMKKCEYIRAQISSLLHVRSVYVHEYLCVYEYMYKLRRNILTKD